MTARSEETTVERLPPDLRHERGPFDIVGDVHGCSGELVELMGRLGYRVALGHGAARGRARVTPPRGRRAIFVGDLVDRGPDTPGVLDIVIDMVERGHAFAVPGNHDDKLRRWLDGREVTISHGLDRTIAQLEGRDAAFLDRVRAFFDRLPHHLWLEGGDLVVAHAGIKEEMLGQASGEVRRFCLYGETSGETDEFGLPVRYHWAAEYRGRPAIVYGHTPVPEAEWVNNTLCIDTGCCFGGKLTALRWPEREIVSVPARAIYSPPARPFGHPRRRPSPAA